MWDLAAASLTALMTKMTDDWMHFADNWGLKIQHITLSWRIILLWFYMVNKLFAAYSLQFSTPVNVLFIQ